MIAVILTLCGAIGQTSCSKEDDGEHQSSADDEQPPQKVTRWECILFGSYPANEVVSGSFNAVDDYALVDGDVITDALLYHQLEQAEWTDDVTCHVNRHRTVSTLVEYGKESTTYHPRLA